MFDITDDVVKEIENLGYNFEGVSSDNTLNFGFKTNKLYEGIFLNICLDRHEYDKIKAKHWPTGSHVEHVEPTLEESKLLNYIIRNY